MTKPASFEGATRMAQTSPIILDAELEIPGATAWLARISHVGPSEAVLRHDTYWLDLSLTPRSKNTRASYVDWAPHRYQPVGRMLLVPAGHACRFRNEGGDMTAVACRIRPDLLRTWCDGELDWTDRLLENGADVANPRLRTPLLRLAEELRAPGLASGTMAELLVGQVAIELARHCSALKEIRDRGGLAAKRLRQIDERLALDDSPPPSLTELAALCGLSVRQLTRGFRESRGHSLGDEIAARRQELAERLLATDASLAEIARGLGYRAQSAFSAAFRKAAGVTPGQFRQRLRN